MHPELESAFGLAGRTCVVTGAGRGIGRQAAVTFAQAGADVVVADVRADELAETARMVTETGQRALSRRVDVSRREEVDDLAGFALAECGRIDVWANVAGILRYSPLTEATEDDVLPIVEVNLLGVYWGVGAAGRAMRASGGSIINISSAGGDVPAPNLSVYGMTKAAVMHLTKTAAVELGPQQIRVNAIAPGFIDTPMVSHYFTDEAGHVDQEARDAIFGTRAAQSPLGTTGVPTDITYCMLYLAADASRFMTGQVLRPNGGVTMP